MKAAMSNVRSQPLFSVDGGSVIELIEDHADELQRLFEECEAYFDLVFGLPVGPAEVQSAFIALPEGKTYEDKYLLGVIDDADRMVGHIDAVKDYPAPGDWSIGILLLAPGVRGRGLGTSLYDGLRQWARSQGANALRIGVVEWNEAALGFCESFGLARTNVIPNHRSGQKCGNLVVFRDPLSEVSE